MKTDDELKAIVQRNLRIFREEKGLNQTQVGEIVNKAKTSVASWEQGKSMPDAVTLYQLARFFGKDLEDFYKIE